jgi:hypothetical protein
MVARKYFAYLVVGTLPNRSAKRRDSLWTSLLTALLNSRQMLKKFVMKNNALGTVSDATFTAHFNRALAKGSENGTFARPKGMSSHRSIQPTMDHMSWCWPSHSHCTLTNEVYRVVASLS